MTVWVSGALLPGFHDPGRKLEAEVRVLKWQICNSSRAEEKLPKRFLPDTRTDKIPYVLLGFEKKCTQLWEDSVNLWQIYRKLGQLLQL